MFATGVVDATSAVEDARGAPLFRAKHFRCQHFREMHADGMLMSWLPQDLHFESFYHYETSSAMTRRDCLLVAAFTPQLDAFKQLLISMA